MPHEPPGGHPLKPQEKLPAWLDRVAHADEDLVVLRDGEPIAAVIGLDGFMDAAPVEPEIEEICTAIHWRCFSGMAFANDRKDYEGRIHVGGVWSLPPTLARGQENREECLGIGESDRATLMFRKPES